MAELTTTNIDLFPPGTVVGAYWFDPAFGIGPEGPPSEFPEQTATVAQDGSLTFYLPAGSYVLYAPDPDRYLRVSVSRARGEKDQAAEAFAFFNS